MSIVRSNQNAPSVETITHELEVSQLAPEPVVTDTHIAPAKVTAPGSGTFVINLDGLYSKEDLTRGVQFNLSDYELGEIPQGRVIVEQLATNAIGSNVPASLMVSTNLFNSGEKVHYLQSGVSNSAGWTTSYNQDELVPVGYVPIVSLMPNEYTRAQHVHYKPGSGVDDGLVQRYGHLSTGAELRNGVVPFPGEDYYYVAKDHVVLDIIERNWKSLGQDVPGEMVREGNWVKVGNGLVEKVLGDLESKVLRHMPLTDMGNLHFLVKADPDLVDSLHDDHEYPLSMHMSVSYRSIAPETVEK